MSSVKIEGNASGTGIFTIASPNSNTNRTLTLPDVTGTFNTSGGVNEVPAGSASAPAIYPTGDTNTGVFFPGSDTIAFTEGGSEAMRIDSSGNVGIGTTSPAIASLASLNVKGNGSNSSIVTAQSSDAASSVAIYSGNNSADNPAVLFQNNLRFGTTTGLGTTGYTERVRITSAGAFCFGKTSDSTTTAGSAIGTNGSANFVASTASPADGPQIQVVNIASSVVNGYRFYSFRINSGATEVGSITTNGSNATSYVTSSDYRLKENVAPMTGALSKIAQLKPSTWTWKNGGTNGQGFIAHELAEVCPDAVVGEKDAVEIYTDDEGNEQTRPRYQGVDTSFLVATLTAAIQELKAELDATKAEVAALKGQA